MNEGVTHGKLPIYRSVTDLSLVKDEGSLARYLPPERHSAIPLNWDLCTDPVSKACTGEKNCACWSTHVSPAIW